MQRASRRARPNDRVKFRGEDLYGVLVKSPPWDRGGWPHVIWGDDDYVCVMRPEEIENVSRLNDENATAVARQCGDSLDSLIQHFARSNTWDDFGPGDNEAWLEQAKMDLTMLASVVEARIQEISPPAHQEFA